MNINGRGREREKEQLIFASFLWSILIFPHSIRFGIIFSQRVDRFSFKHFFLSSKEEGDSAIENCSKFYIEIWLPSWKSLDELIHLRIENTMPPLLLGRSTKNGNVIFPPLPSRRNLDKTPDTHHCASFSIASRLSCPLDKKKEEEEEKKNRSRHKEWHQWRDSLRSEGRGRDLSNRCPKLLESRLGKHDDAFMEDRFFSPFDNFEIVFEGKKEIKNYTPPFWIFLDASSWEKGTIRDEGQSRYELA